MNFITFRNVGLVIVAAAAFIVAGCSSNSGAPSTTAVKSAFVAGNDAESNVSGQSTYDDSTTWQSNTYTATYTNTAPGGSGSASVSFTTTNLNTTPFQFTGTITFTNWYDPSSGYTINGKITITESVTNNSSTYSVTGTTTGTLNLTGGSISTLTYNISTSATVDLNNPANSTASYTGTINADGYTYNVSSILS